MEKGLTLVISLYNKLPAIKNTLDSVLNNHGNYPFKCIIVDDDSTDGCSNIAEAYDICYPDIFTYVKIKHHGPKHPANARNFGIKLAETEYLAFLDGDNELCPGFIDRGCNFLDENPQYALYGNGHKGKFIKTIGNNPNQWFNTKETVYNLGKYRKEGKFEINSWLEYLNCGWENVHWSANIFKTNLVKQNLFTDCYGEDSVFKLKYIYKNPHIFIDNTTCESIIFNSQYSQSQAWGNRRTKEGSYIYEMFKTIEKEIPDFIYEIKTDENNNISLIKKSE